MSAVNRWATGWQILIYQNKTSFERAKAALENEGVIPQAYGYTEVNV